jgi:hypothetical protein
MKNGWVIYRDLDEGELYVDAIQDKFHIEVTDDPEAAMQFASAREAYDWARMKNLDWWKVGAR